MADAMKPWGAIRSRVDAKGLVLCAHSDDQRRGVEAFGGHLALAVLRGIHAVLP